MVTGGLVAHPFAAAGDMLRFYREFTRTVPDELTVFAGLVHAPDGSGMKLAPWSSATRGRPSRPRRTSRRFSSSGRRP